MTKPINLKSSKLDLLVELTRCRLALEKIKNWEMPYPTYQHHWGIDGVKELMQGWAKYGLDPNSPIYIHKEPDVIEDLKTFGFNKRVAESKG